MMSTTQKRILLGLIAIVLVFAWNGCAFLGKEPIEPRVDEREQAPPAEAKLTTSVDAGPPREEVRPPKKSAGLVHRVQWQGETLSIIAKWYTGKLKNWKALAKANPKLKPNRIVIGNKIHIPEDLLNTREPMPKEFLAAFTSKPKKKRSASKPKPPPEEETEPVLFGPKEYPK
jgi:LysM repeat protein